MVQSQPENGDWWTNTDVHHVEQLLPLIDIEVDVCHYSTEQPIIVSVDVGVRMRVEEC